MFDGLEKTFTEHNLAVSIVNSPNNRPEPIIGFTFGMCNPIIFKPFGRKSVLHDSIESNFITE